MNSAGWRLPDQFGRPPIRLFVERIAGLGGATRRRTQQLYGGLYAGFPDSVPGMTETSDVPAAAAAEGTRYDDLVLQILESAAARLQAGG